MKDMRIFVILLVFTLGSANAHSQETGPANSEMTKSLTSKVREELAQKASEKKDHQRVIDLLAPYSNEISDDGLILLSESYGALKDYLNQIRTLQIYQTRRPDRFRPHYLLGLAFAANKQTDEAVQNLRKSIEFAPKHRPSYDAILQIMLDKKDYYEARTLLAQMVKVFGQKPEFLNLQCRLFSEGGYLAEAEETCKLALRRDKNKPDNHVYLAQALLNQERKQAAENVFKNAVRQFPKSELVLFAVGEFYFNEKNYATAVRYLSEGIKIKPNSARSQLGLALSLFELKKWQEALVHYAKACELDETRVAYNEFRSAAAKLRQTDEYKLAQEYERKIATCR